MGDFFNFVFQPEFCFFHESVGFCLVCVWRGCTRACMCVSTLTWQNFNSKLRPPRARHTLKSLLGSWSLWVDDSQWAPHSLTLYLGSSEISQWFEGKLPGLPLVFLLSFPRSLPSISSHQHGWPWPLPSLPSLSCGSKCSSWKPVQSGSRLSHLFLGHSLSDFCLILVAL